MRWIVHSFWLYLAVILILNLVRALFPASRDFLTFIWLPFGLSMLAVGPAWFVVGSAFLFRLVRCPRCGDSFTDFPIPSYVPRRCAHCGFDSSQIETWENEA